MAKKRSKIILLILSIFIICGIIVCVWVKNVLATGFNIDKTVYIKIDENKNYSSVLSQIRNSAHVTNISNFKLVASALDYPSYIKSGCYAITPQMNVLDAVRLLKSGHQTPVKLTFNNIRTKKNLAKRLSQQLMIRSSDIVNALNDSAVCSKYSFNTETIKCMFIPNTYEIYWNTSVDKFLERINSEYKKFWDEDKLAKCKEIGLSPMEVSILASIVEEECYFEDEYPIVAGLYLNRLKKGMLLQADPTVKYALGDFTLRRILNKHLEIDSPYNTYKNTGLPPAPIRIPSIKAINSVLNYSPSNYLYMCAKEDFSGRHNFAVTHPEHERNAIRYQSALNKRRIFN